ncbi:MAG: ABC transporter permease [Actinomycetota bacterium]|nr:ABC transporter permease [Actinomycetota bacterium]
MTTTSPSGMPSGGPLEKSVTVEVPGSQRRLAGALEAYALPIAWVAIIIIFSFVKPETFAQWSNVSSILSSNAVLVVITLALIIPLTTGDFDLSVAAVAGLSAVTVAHLNVNVGWPLFASILAALAVAFLIGLINGGLIVLLGIESLIVTLGMSTIVTGVMLWVTDARTVTGVDQTLVDMVIRGRFLGIPYLFFYALVLTIIIWYVFQFTPLGQRMLVAGRNRDVARLAGMRVGLLRWGAMIAASLIAAIGGILIVGLSSSAGPSTGVDYLLPAFAAAFLGSTTIRPGRFNAWGTFIAVYFLVTGITALQLLGAKTFVQYLFYGTALILAVALSQHIKRRRLKQGF